MDDYCQKAKVFTNKEAQYMHKYEHSSDLTTMYKKSLGVAFKHCKETEEVPGLNHFMGVDEKKPKISRDKYEHDDIRWRIEVDKL